MTTSSAGTAPLAEGFAPRPSLEQIESALRAALQPLQLQVHDDSAHHAGHAGAREGGHFRVQIVAACMAGLRPVQRHRLIYDALSAWMPRGIHALVIDARSPDEAAAR